MIEGTAHFQEDLVYKLKPTENDEAILDNLTELYCLMDDFFKELIFARN